MSVFWVFAAGLSGLALLFIVPPLLRKKNNAEPGAADTIDTDDVVALALHRRRVDVLTEEKLPALKPRGLAGSYNRPDHSCEFHSFHTSIQHAHRPPGSQRIR